MDTVIQESFDTVMAFMGAMGAGDMVKIRALMAEDMVWHNEGDESLPWIGEARGNEAVFDFLGVFGQNFQTTAWDNTDAFAAGDTVAVFGKMSGITTKSGKETGPFTFALRAKVRDGQVVLWHWFEDSFAVSQAYHGYYPQQGTARQALPARPKSKESPMRYAVTAVSGQLGQEIARKLIERTDRASVIGLARTPGNVTELGIKVRPGDYDQPDALRTSLAGVDALVLVSGMAPPEDRIGQHRNVIEAAKAAGVGKIVYTSIQGPEVGTVVSPVVQSNRQTEADIRASGLDWTIGRNGIYIEPDVEYIDSYRAKGEIANSAGGGKCGYTTRSELAHAYAALLTRNELNGQTFDLNGTPITQAELTQYMNATYGTALTYRSMPAEDYVVDRTAELGDFIGPIIGGIYDGIRRGDFDAPGDYEAATGRPHQSWEDYFTSLLR